MYKSIVLFLVVFLVGCNGMTMPEMPKMPELSMPYIQMPAFFKRNSEENSRPSLNENTNPQTEALSSNNAASDITPPAIVMCRITDGLAYFGGEWHEYAPASVIVQEGQQSQFSANRLWGSGQTAGIARYDADGQKLVFCPGAMIQNYNSDIRCQEIFALSDDLQRGIKRTLDVEPLFRSARIDCRKST